MRPNGLMRQVTGTNVLTPAVRTTLRMGGGALDGLQLGLRQGSGRSPHSRWDRRGRERDFDGNRGGSWLRFALTRSEKNELLGG